MKLRRSESVEANADADADATMSLDQIERLLTACAVRMPSDATMLRESSKALRAVTSGVVFATLTCEVGEHGARITEGREALDAARVLRAWAAHRGDTVWAAILGRSLRFRIVRSEAPAPPSNRSRRLRSASRLVVRGARMAAG